MTTTTTSSSSRSTAEHELRVRQRAVAEREAGRLARPEPRTKSLLGHADRTKSAVSSLPSGVYHHRPNSNNGTVSTSMDTNLEWCGPFSVARQMIAKREQAKLEEKAEGENSNDAAAMYNHPLDSVMEELDMEKKRKAHPSMLWKPSQHTRNKNDISLYAKRQKRVQLLQQGRTVPSLFALCLQYLVENFEHVESLGNIDSAIHTAITNQLVAMGKLNGDCIQTLLAEPNMEALELIDCSGITSEELCAGLANLTQLKYLILDQCGRCCDSTTVETICKMSYLFAISIGGAYLLKDQDAAKLISICQPCAIEFKACPQLGMHLCTNIRDTYVVPKQDKMLLELCLEDIPLTKEQLETLTMSPSLSHLKSLSMRRIGGLTDDGVAKLLARCGSTLEGLDLADNMQLSDSILASIRAYCTGPFHVLTLTALKQLTNAGLEAFFTMVDGASPPPLLQILNLDQLYQDTVSDQIIYLITQSTTQQQQYGGLTRLNVQNSPQLSDTALEHLAAACSNTLEEINVSFCPLITDQGLGFLVDRCNHQLCKLLVWGNAQLTDQFFDGNLRANDANFEIIGIWMKKAASRTIR